MLVALAHLPEASGAVVCPAFPENGRSVFQGHLCVADRLLSESGMQNHPLTPLTFMTDPDLRRVLAAQSARTVGHIPAPIVGAGAPAITPMLAADAHLLTDAITDADLMHIGLAAKDSVLLCGGSGIALGLPSNFGTTPSLPDWQGVAGADVVFSGSCSIATRG